jgi:hypothetical protein
VNEEEKKNHAFYAMFERRQLSILPLLERDVPGEEGNPIIRGNGVRKSAVK